MIFSLPHRSVLTATIATVMFTAPMAAAALPAPTLSNAGPDYLTVSWPAGTGATYISWSTAATGPFTGMGTSGTSASISGLTAGTDYYVKLQNTSGDGPVTKFTTAAPAPTAPPPTVAETKTDSIRFTWTAPTTAAFAGANKYELNWRLKGTYAISSLAATSTGVTLTGLKPATAYEVRLNIYKVGSWVYSSPFVAVTTASATAPAPAPAPTPTPTPAPAPAIDPLTIKTPTLTANSAVIGWTAAVPGATSYVVTASLDPAFTAGTLTTSQTVTTVTPVTFSGLAYNQKYYFRVSATVAGVAKLGPTLTVAMPTDQTTTVSAPFLYVLGVHAQALQLTTGQAGTTWTSANVGKVDYYRIAKMVKLANGYHSVQGYATTSLTVYRETGLAAGTQVYWRIQNCWAATGCGVAADYRYTVK